MVHSVSRLKRDHLVQCNYLKLSFYLHFRKVIHHGAVCLFSSHNREPSSSLKLPYVDLQLNRDSNMPHCTSYTCSNSTGKEVSVSCLFVTLWINQNWNSGPVNSLEQSQTQWLNEWWGQTTGFDWPNYENDHKLGMEITCCSMSHYLF